MTEMTKQQLQILGAEAGAYSIVTPREATRDRSITLDKYEKSVLIQKYPMDIFKRRGGINDDGRKERHSFFCLDNINICKNRALNLAIVFPKKKGKELRLYMSTADNFTCNPGDYFVIFSSHSAPHPTVGFVPASEWESLWINQRQLPTQTIEEIDPDDTEYQNKLRMEQAGLATEQNRMVWPRSAQTAKQALEATDYKCEFDNKHESFISPITNKQYMEAHHLVPMANQNSFLISLDNIRNVISLCPNCHKKIHLGTQFDKQKMLIKLYKNRYDFLSQLKIKLEDIYCFYGVNTGK